MRRRVSLALLGIVLVWTSLEFWFGLHSPRKGVARSGEHVLSAYDPTAEQLAKWEAGLDLLRRRPSPPRLMSFSARYGWWHLPGSSELSHGVTVHVNGVGARGTRELTDEPPGGALRVACYGESFTFGTDVADDQAWPARLEARAAGDLEVWNFGVGAWGTDQALLRFRDTRDQLDSDVVLIGLLSENICRNVNRLRCAYQDALVRPLVKPRFLLEGEELVLLAHPYQTELESYEAAVDGSLGLDLAPHEWWGQKPARTPSFVLTALERRFGRSKRGRWTDMWVRPEGEPFRVTVALLEAFHAEALQGGARFAGVVIFPAQSDVELSTPLPLLRDALESRAIPYVDLFDTVRARYERGERTYGGTHFTPETNDEVAGVILAWLGEQL